MGNPLSDWVDARARLLESTNELAKQRQRLYAKYGDAFRQFDQPGPQRVVLEISPHEAVE
jgi:hypothetical protein